MSSSLRNDWLKLQWAAVSGSFCSCINGFGAKTGCQNELKDTLNCWFRVCGTELVSECFRVVAVDHYQSSSSSWAYRNRTSALRLTTSAWQSVSVPPWSLTLSESRHLVPVARDTTWADLRSNPRKEMEDVGKRQTNIYNSSDDWRLVDANDWLSDGTRRSTDA